jgi:ubiquitin conjugation factor E4 A
MALKVLYINHFVFLFLFLGMTVYLSMRSALTEPTFLEMTLNFHIATSTWLSLFAVKDNPQCFSDIKLPLPVQTPKCLACIPEFIMGNITDFTQFLHRFKDQIFEVGHK